MGIILKKNKAVRNIIIEILKPLRFNSFKPETLIMELKKSKLIPVFDKNVD